MFLFFSKLLPVLFFPVGLAGVLLLISFFLKSRKWRSRLVFGGFLLIWLMGNNWTASFLLRSLEWQYLPREKYPQADAIVILGGGTLPAEFPRQTVELNFAGDRVIYGARLYKAGVAPVVVVTGGNLPWTSTEGSPATDMVEFLVFLGVPEEAILVESESANTYENAFNTREILESFSADTIILVTSPLHMPRSVPLFEKQGFTTIPAPTDYTVTRSQNQKPFSQTWPDLFFSLFPSASALNDTTLALKEYVGIAVYRLRGWY